MLIWLSINRFSETVQANSRGDMSGLPDDIRVDTSKLRAFAGGYKTHAEAIREDGKPIVSYIASLLEAMPEYDGRLQSAARAEAADIDGKCGKFYKDFLEDSDSLIHIANAFEKVDGQTVDQLALCGLSLKGIAEGLVSITAAYIEQYFGKYHQNQGPTTHCGDFSLSMVCNIYYDHLGEPTSRCDVANITAFLDKFFWLGFRFPDPGKFPAADALTGGGATIQGITAALLYLGIPFTFNPFGTLDDIENALREGKIVMVSEGQILDSNNQLNIWGHVMVIVGEDGDDFLLLDPSAPPGSGVTRINKQVFLNQWWHDPVHPCWIIG
jgi:hypothetical protein